VRAVGERHVATSLERVTAPLRGLFDEDERPPVGTGTGGVGGGAGATAAAAAAAAARRRDSGGGRLPDEADAAAFVGVLAAELSTAWEGGEALWSTAVANVLRALRLFTARAEATAAVRAGLALRHCAIVISPYVLAIAQRISIGQLLSHIAIRTVPAFPHYSNPTSGSRCSTPIHPPAPRNTRSHLHHGTESAAYDVKAGTGKRSVGGGACTLALRRGDGRSTSVEGRCHSPPTGVLLARVKSTDRGGLRVVPQHNYRHAGSCRSSDLLPPWISIRQRFWRRRYLSLSFSPSCADLAKARAQWLNIWRSGTDRDALRHPPSQNGEMAHR